MHLYIHTTEFPAIDLSDPARGIDFCVALGGDGTILHLASLFQGQGSTGSVPPVVSFALGSLGFLVRLAANYMIDAHTYACMHAHIYSHAVFTSHSIFSHPI
jgi:NAD kinase